MPRKSLLVLVLVALLALGVGGALAIGETTTTVSACATASTPAHTVAVDGTGVSTIPGASSTECTTSTVTIPTTTETVAGPTTTVTTTVTAPTTTTPTEAPYFSDTFESPKFSTAWAVTGPSSNFITVPGAHGNGLALRTTPGQSGPNSSSVMTALNFWPYQQAHATNGESTWYHVRLRVPSPVPSCGAWNWLNVWHVDNDSEVKNGPHLVSPALGIYTDSPSSCANPRLIMRYAGGSGTSPTYEEFNVSAPFQFGHWYDLLWHYVWSPSNTTGLEEIWVDGVQKVSKNTATLFQNTDGTVSFNSFGLYNYHYVSPTLGDHQSQTEWDDVSYGPTRASVGG